jgi:hypothetical protein
VLEKAVDIKAEISSESYSNCPKKPNHPTLPSLLYAILSPT